MSGNPQLIMLTSLGELELELFEAQAPITVQNFLDYVDAEFFDGTIFHRVIPDFMVQGGGFSAGMAEKPTRETIKNEAANGLANKRGTIAMARTSEVDSASSQFFINLKDNDFLNHKGPAPETFGYCVFGRVTAGMATVDKIAAEETGISGPHQGVPLTPVLINSVRRK